MTESPSHLRERVRRMPGMQRLLPTLEGLPPAYLVCGAVRGLLRDAEPVDVDIAVDGDARSAARAVPDRLGSRAGEYDASALRRSRPSRAPTTSPVREKRY